MREVVFGALLMPVVYAFFALVVFSSLSLKMQRSAELALVNIYMCVSYMCVTVISCAVLPKERVAILIFFSAQPQNATFRRALPWQMWALKCRLVLHYVFVYVYVYVNVDVDVNMRLKVERCQRAAELALRYMCICMYMYTHTKMYVYTHIYTHVYLHILIYRRVYV